MTTKFEIGQEVYYLTEKGIRKGKVYAITIKEFEELLTIWRNVNTYDQVERDAKNCAASKEALIDKLENEL